MFNIGVIIEQSLLYIPIVLGAYGIFSIMRIPALCLESAFLIGAITGVMVHEMSGLSPVMGLLLGSIGAAVGGLLVGGCMGTLMQYGKFSPLLSAILTIGIFQSCAYFLLGSSHKIVGGTYNPFLSFPFSIAGYPALIAIGLLSILVLVIMKLFFATELGMSCVFYGNNPAFCDTYKISTSFVVIVGLMIMHALAGISGYSIASANGFIDTSMGIGIVLTSITALVLGSVIQQLIGRSLIIPIIGIVTYFILQSLLLRIGFDLHYFTAVHALVVAIFLLLFKQRRPLSPHDELGI